MFTSPHKCFGLICSLGKFIAVYKCDYDTYLPSTILSSNTTTSKIHTLEIQSGKPFSQPLLNSLTFKFIFLHEKINFISIIINNYNSLKRLASYFPNMNMIKYKSALDLWQEQSWSKNAKKFPDVSKILILTNFIFCNFSKCLQGIHMPNDISENRKTSNHQPSIYRNQKNQYKKC